VIVNGNRQHLFAVRLANHMLVELRHDIAWRRNVAEQGFRSTAAALFLFQDGLAQVDALATDVNIAGALDERAYVAITFATKRTKGVLLGRTRTLAASSEVFSCGHSILLVGSRRGLRRANQSMFVLEWLRWLKAFCT